MKSKTLDTVYIAVAAALICVCSWVTIPLTVPITLQTLGVCLTAGLLGAKRGTLAVALYILLGAIGVPVFHGFTGGIGILLGSTGGYIIGFIFTALITGFTADKHEKKPLTIILAMVAGVLVCYIFGTAWFAYVYARTNEPAALKTILGWCVFPYLLPDAAKIALAAVLTGRLRPLLYREGRTA